MIIGVPQLTISMSKHIGSVPRLFRLADFGVGPRDTYGCVPDT